MVSETSAMHRVVVLSGKRTPFLKANTQFNDVKGFELLRHALAAAVTDVQGLDKRDINYVIAGLTPLSCHYTSALISTRSFTC